MKGESRGSSKHEDGEGAKSAGSGPVVSGGHERRGAWNQIGHGRWEKEMGAARKGDLGDKGAGCGAGRGGLKEVRAIERRDGSKGEDEQSATRVEVRAESLAMLEGPPQVGENGGAWDGLLLEKHGTGSQAFEEPPDEAEIYEEEGLWQRSGKGRAQEQLGGKAGQNKGNRKGGPANFCKPRDARNPAREGVPLERGSRNLRCTSQMGSPQLSKRARTLPFLEKFGRVVESCGGRVEASGRSQGREVGRGLRGP